MIADVKARAAAEMLQGATITLTNFGAIAGRYASPIVTPPQVAIIGAGKLFEKVVFIHGEARPVSALPLSMTFDHRACTGGEAARFLKALVQALEAAVYPAAGGVQICFVIDKATYNLNQLERAIVMSMNMMFYIFSCCS
jgi:hypothetical protein